MYQVECFEYNTWQEAHAARKNDYCVYLFDVLPIDELQTPGMTSYIGSAGANAKREGETKSAAYVKSTLDARYRGGSYTKNHTRPQQVQVLVVSRNEQQQDESVKEFRSRCNVPGHKYDERAFLGFLENKLHEVAVDLNLNLNNAECPKCQVFEQYDDIFSQVQFVGEVPAIVQIAQGDLTIEDYRQQQKEHTIAALQAQLQQLTA